MLSNWRRRPSGAREAGSLASILTDADERPTGCLLLDLHMPDADGLALQDMLPWRGINLPAVFNSGRGDIASSVLALKAGATDFLTNPVPTETLPAAVRASLMDKMGAVSLPELVRLSDSLPGSSAAR